MTHPPSNVPAAAPAAPWLNRTTLGVSLANLFSDISHEMATAVLPARDVLMAEGSPEKAYAASLLPADRRGTGMGLLAATNGIGDMVSSTLVGTRWAVFPEPAWGFGIAGVLQFAGASRIAFARNHDQGK